MFPLPPSSGSARDAASAADAHTSHPREARVLRMGRFLPESAGRLSPPFLQPLQAGDGRRKVGERAEKAGLFGAFRWNSAGRPTGSLDFAGPAGPGAGFTSIMKRTYAEKGSGCFKSLQDGRESGLQWSGTMRTGTLFCFAFTSGGTVAANAVFLYPRNVLP